MKLKDIRNNRWVRIFANKYTLVLAAFCFWMLFLDSNSWLIHRELDLEIDDLKKNKEYYLNEISRDKAIMDNLNDSLELEKFARQEYFMKRENEEIFIIEYKEAVD
ncbi:septum formation initiator family protein [Salinimicrobium tongyeongense]|uniref:Septum formation initiator family protein n=1 Tax=Salinimicrobium tongyeongense TaxID=2809707 RepID=A0ABY6NSS6_9FLAO|nr:septum formation initiator family protein [Salinimicrobium tongyeongense]UZH55621.1 septum formation initiator family protein [Salinimicrobium tongyeongense]